MCKHCGYEKGKSREIAKLIFFIPDDWNRDDPEDYPRVSVHHVSNEEEPGRNLIGPPFFKDTEELSSFLDKAMEQANGLFADMFIKAIGGKDTAFMWAVLEDLKNVFELRVRDEKTN